MSRQDRKNQIKYLITKKQYKEALELLEIYLDNYPYDYYMISYKITLLYRLGKKDEASTLVDEVLESDIIDRDLKKYIFETLAIDEFTEKNYEQSIEYWKECIELYAPKIYVRAACSLSLNYLRLDRIEEALEIVAARPDFNPVAFNVARSRVYYELEDYSKALEELEKDTIESNEELEKDTIESNEEQINSYLADKLNIQGLIYERMSDKQEYTKNKKLLQKALELHEKARRMSSNEKAIYWESTIHAAGINFNLGNEEIGKRMCNEILKECRKNRIRSSAISLIACNHIKNFCFDDAEKVFDQYGEKSLKRVIGYAKVAIARYDFDNAYKLLTSINTMDEDIRYSKNYLMAQLMFRKNDYKEFLKYYQLIILSKNGDRNSNILYDIKKMLFMLEVYNNLPLTQRPRSYYENQIVSYDEDLAIENNIQYRINADDKEIFSPNTDIRKLYSDVKDYLHKDRCLCDGIYDKYIVDMSEIGEIKENLRFVTVVCLANTKNIVKIYPSNQYVGIFVEPTSVQPVQKTRLSAMEKFNKKYGL